MTSDEITDWFEEIIENDLHEVRAWGVKLFEHFFNIYEPLISEDKNFDKGRKKYIHIVKSIKEYLDNKEQILSGESEENELFLIQSPEDDELPEELTPEFTGQPVNLTEEQINALKTRLNQDQKSL